MEGADGPPGWQKRWRWANGPDYLARVVEGIMAVWIDGDLKHQEALAELRNEQQIVELQRFPLWKQQLRDAEDEQWLDELNAAVNDLRIAERAVMTCILRQAETPQERIIVLQEVLKSAWFRGTER